MAVFQHVYTVGLRSAKCKIWHDPQTALPDNVSLTSIFKGSIAGANADMLLDTGAAANCISEEFCRVMRIKVHPAKAATVTSYGGQADQIDGTTVAKLAIQSYTSTMQFLVLKMDKSIDCILGEPWHKANRAVHQYTARGLDTVALTNSRSRRKLTQPKTPEVSPRVNRLVQSSCQIHEI